MPEKTQVAKRKNYKSVLRYPGGKSRLIKELAGYLPTTKIDTYSEPFCGGASMLFHMKSNDLATSYRINDAYGALIDFYQTVADPEGCDLLMKNATYIYYKFPTMEDRKKWFHDNRDFASFPVERHRALCFFIYNRISFSGTVEAGGFSPDASMGRFTLSSIDRLKMMPESLKNVTITNKDFSEEILEAGDGTLMYLDPPYFTNSKLYGKNGELHNIDHTRLANSLMNSAAKFILSYDDCPEIHALYSDWANIYKSSEQAYGMSNGTRKQELIITNY